MTPSVHGPITRPRATTLALPCSPPGALATRLRRSPRSCVQSPEYLQARYNLGNALMAAARPTEAIAQFEYVLSRMPQDAAALSDLGSALATTGRVAEARRALERSLEVNPANAKAHYNLGLIAAQSPAVSPTLKRTSSVRWRSTRPIRLCASPRAGARGAEAVGVWGRRGVGAWGVWGCGGVGAWGRGGAGVGERAPTPLRTHPPHALSLRS